MNRLIQSLGELASTDENYEFYGDITFTYVTTEKRKTTYSNKLLMFLNWPHLKDALQECDAVILAEDLLIEEDTTAEVDIELITESTPVKDFKSSESSEIIPRKECRIDKDHLCQLCGRSFPIHKSLKNHISNVHSNRSYSCNTCGKVLGSRSSYTNHLKIHNKPNGELECDICGVKIKLKRNFEQHYLAHIEAKTFKCPTCGRSFNSKQHLRRHEEIHDNHQYLCNSCGKEFSVKGYYLTHRKKCKSVVII